MHILVITFQLDGMPVADYLAFCDEVAPDLAAIPGLISKVWLQDEETNTYGGIYTWGSREAMDAFLQSEPFLALGSNPAFVNAGVRDFATLEGPTRATRGLVGIQV